MPLLLALLLSACGDTDGAACDTLAPTTCADRSDCAVITARPLIDDGAGGLCVDGDTDPEPVGCMDADQGCDDIVVVPTDPDGDANCDRLFANSCLPSGWVDCPGAPTDDCPG